MLRGMLEALASRGVASVVLTFNSKHVVAKVGVGARSPACMHAWGNVHPRHTYARTAFLVLCL